MSYLVIIIYITGPVGGHVAPKYQCWKFQGEKKGDTDGHNKAISVGKTVHFLCKCFIPQFISDT